jgi:hypothetical protein
MDWEASVQGLILVHFRAQLDDLWRHIAHVGAQFEHLRDTSTGYLGYTGENLCLVERKWASELKLSENVDECKPLPAS